jgi:hypothetical protein
MKQIRTYKEPTYSKKRKQGLCVALHCRKSAGKNTKWCYKHNRQHQKINNPSRYFFDHLRQNAKRRGIDFKWSIEEFREFCKETGYLEKKGREKTAYSIDRIDPTKPYQKDNVQVLTVGMNSRKRHVDFKILHGRYPTKEDLEYLQELMRNEANDEPQFPFSDEVIDSEEVPF